MAFDGALNSACLQLVTQVKQLEQSLRDKHAELTNLLIRQQALEVQHNQCEQDTEAMITPSPCHTGKSETDQFTALLLRSWRLKQAIDKYHTRIQRLKHQIIRLEKRIQTLLALKAKAMKALKRGRGNQKLQSELELVLVKNQLWLGQFS